MTTHDTTTRDNKATRDSKATESTMATMATRNEERIPDEEGEGEGETLVRCQPSGVLRRYAPRSFLLLALRNTESAVRDAASELVHGNTEDDLHDLAGVLDTLADNIRTYLRNTRPDVE